MTERTFPFKIPYKLQEPGFDGTGEGISKRCGTDPRINPPFFDVKFSEEGEGGPVPTTSLTHTSCFQ